MHKAPEQPQVHLRNAAGDLDLTSAALSVDGKTDLDHTIFGSALAALQGMAGPGQTPKLTTRRRARSTAAAAGPLESKNTLCPSPPCGFSSTVEGSALTVDQEKAELASVVETAAGVWG